MSVKYKYNKNWRGDSGTMICATAGSIFYDIPKEEKQGIVDLVHKTWECTGKDEITKLYQEFIKIAMSFGKFPEEIIAAIDANRGANNRSGFKLTDDFVRENIYDKEFEVKDNVTIPPKSSGSSTPRNKRFSSVWEVGKSIFKVKEARKSEENKAADNNKPDEPATDDSVNECKQKDPFPKLSNEEKVELLKSRFNLIEGTHPDFTITQINSLLWMLKSKNIKARCKENDVDYKTVTFIEVPLSKYRGTDGYDIAFEIKTKDRPIVIFYNTIPKPIKVCGNMCMSNKSVIFIAKDEDLAA